jgi:hypothetical protein
MTKSDEYRAQLRSLESWDAYLLQESGLPGPRGNLELVLRRCASDPRWRLREGVTMALQRIGEADMDGLLVEMDDWSRGTPLEQRAAAACSARISSDCMGCFASHLNWK